MGSTPPGTSHGKLSLHGISFGRKHLCNCGHHRDYHIDGRTKCVVSICECGSYQACGHDKN